ncbi:hypothetical protein [Agrococcus jejuensis]|uniref:Uncharacterized protein n=1 Tax=Agrococcus jejuensis TaxID=399736 RepID=A0A1G8B4M2_9MICO|nr:hypothetical protein [Agrococcus jejuensis]SDH28084.1 hypothetical protein SAMN04489720_0657 [Agrococcus jejuensis]
MTIRERLRRFWQSLTGSGVQTYGDDPLPGQADETNPGLQGSSDIQARNRHNTAQGFMG